MLNQRTPGKPAAYALAAACLVSLGSGSCAHAAPQEALVLQGARIHTVSHGTIDRGVLVIEGGRIRAVGAEGEVAVPPGARIEDVAGKVVIPGLVDTHSHLGVYPRPGGIPAHADGNEMTGPVQGGVRALDAVWPGDPGIRMALAGGVTTANIMPGSGNVVGGATVYVKLRGRTVEEMLISNDGVEGGLKMANGENPKRSYGGRGQAPSTRMAVAALQRRAFVQAQEYRRKWEAYRQAKSEGKDVEEPPRDLTLEPLVEALEGRRIVHFHTHRADDILTALRLAEEFGFRIVLQHVTEGHLVAEEIARRKVPCSIIVLDSPGGKPEAVHLTFENGAVLERAGVNVAIHSDDPIIGSRFLLRAAALAVRGGMSEEGALRALTLNAAAMLGLEERIGSIEPGKDADLVVLSGEPFRLDTKVLATYIEGEKVFDRSRPEDRLYATGGFAVRERYPSLEEEK